MQYADMIAEARGILGELDPANSHVTDATLMQWANACTLQLFSLIGTYPKTSITGITGAASITLPTSVLRLDYAAIAMPSGKHTKLATIDFCNFVRYNPNWPDTSVNRPDTLVRMNDTDWMLYPNPNADYAGAALTLYGSVLPTPDTDPTLSPPINQSLHACYSHYMAWKAFLLLNNPERAGAEFNIYDGLRKLNTRSATSTLGSLQSLRMRP